jgi:hypothetical protein
MIAFVHPICLLKFMVQHAPSMLILYKVRRLLRPIGGADGEHLGEHLPHHPAAAN